MESLFCIEYSVLTCGTQPRGRCWVVFAMVVRLSSVAPIGSKLCLRSVSRASV